MAVSKIDRPCVQIGSSATEASITANPSANQMMQIVVGSSMGRYMLFVTNSGINLYDLTHGQMLHSMSWDS